MNKILSITGRVTISLILSGSMLAGVVAIFRYLDPAFTIDFFDLLAQFSLVTWMVFLLTAAIVFAILTKLPVFVRARLKPKKPLAAPRKQSD